MSSTTARVRDGTALRQRGRDRVRHILHAARTLFLNEGYQGLSLRRVAELAGISLGNLTYYFSSKTDLFESMIDDVLGEYSGRWQQISKQYADNADAELDAYLRFLFADCQRAETQHFFYQFWAVAAHDPRIAEARDRTYFEFGEQLAGYCKSMNPRLSETEINERVLLLMAQVEGLHVVFGTGSRRAVSLDSLEREFKRQVLQIIRS